MEAGHRCAIPSCRQHPVEIAHVDPRKSDGSNDRFENLIALCPTCHTRYDGGEIDRTAMRQYKANLSVLNSRYGDVEKKALEYFADNPGLNAIQMPGGLKWQLQYLLLDGLLEELPIHSGVEMAGMRSHDFFAITPAGRAFIARWLEAEELDQ